MIMRRFVNLAGVVAIAATLSACTATTGPKATGGTLIGAALGGLTGAQIGGGKGRLAAVAIGTLVGAAVGHDVGQSMDRADRDYAARSAVHGLEYEPAGAASEWHNPDTGHSGSFTPTRTYQSADGAYCREYQQTVTVGGRTESAYGTACRQPDGSWRMVETR